MKNLQKIFILGIFIILMSSLCLATMQTYSIRDGDVKIYYNDSGSDLYILNGLYDDEIFIEIDSDRDIAGGNCIPAVRLDTTWYTWNETYLTDVTVYNTTDYSYFEYRQLYEHPNVGNFTRSLFVSADDDTYILVQDKWEPIGDVYDNSYMYGTCYDFINKNPNKVWDYSLESFVTADAKILSDWTTWDDVAPYNFYGKTILNGTIRYHKNETYPTIFDQYSTQTQGGLIFRKSGDDYGYARTYMYPSNPTILNGTVITQSTLLGINSDNPKLSGYYVNRQVSRNPSELGYFGGGKIGAYDVVEGYSYNLWSLATYGAKFGSLYWNRPTNDEDYGYVIDRDLYRMSLAKLRQYLDNGSDFKTQYHYIPDENGNPNVNGIPGEHWQMFDIATIGIYSTVAQMSADKSFGEIFKNYDSEAVSTIEPVVSFIHDFLPNMTINNSGYTWFQHSMNETQSIDGSLQRSYVLNTHVSGTLALWKMDQAGYEVNSTLESESLSALEALLPQYELDLEGTGISHQYSYRRWFNETPFNGTVDNSTSFTSYHYYTSFLLGNLIDTINIVDSTHDTTNLETSLNQSCYWTLDIDATGTTSNANTRYICSFIVGDSYDTINTYYQAFIDNPVAPYGEDIGLMRTNVDFEKAYIGTLHKVPTKNTIVASQYANTYDENALHVDSIGFYKFLTNTGNIAGMRGHQYRDFDISSNSGGAEIDFYSDNADNVVIHKWWEVQEVTNANIILESTEFTIDSITKSGTKTIINIDDSVCNTKQIKIDPYCNGDFYYDITPSQKDTWESYEHDGITYDIKTTSSSCDINTVEITSSSGSDSCLTLEIDENIPTPDGSGVKDIFQALRDVLGATGFKSEGSLIFFSLLVIMFLMIVGAKYGGIVGAIFMAVLGFLCFVVIGWIPIWISIILIILVAVIVAKIVSGLGGG